MIVTLQFTAWAKRTLIYLKYFSRYILVIHTQFIEAAEQIKLIYSFTKANSALVKEANTALHKSIRKKYFTSIYSLIGTIFPYLISEGCDGQTDKPRNTLSFII